MRRSSSKFCQAMSKNIVGAPTMRGKRGGMGRPATGCGRRGSRNEGVKKWKRRGEAEMKQRGRWLRKRNEKKNLGF